MSELSQKARKYLDAVGEGEWTFRDPFMADLAGALEEAERERDEWQKAYWICARDYGQLRNFNGATKAAAAALHPESPHELV